LREIYGVSAQQSVLGREVIRRFGRHPHRNEILGRESTSEEAAYIQHGVFPHNRTIEGME
jgi:uncharacterized protein (DUF924 family)